jgi:hypothetical protein
MVTRSVVDYQKHKEDIYNLIKEKNGIEKAEKFIRHYSSRYDKYNRSYIDWQLAYSLMSDYKHLQKKGSKWYAYVGVGGTGKTTLMKNVSYFLDPDFNPDTFARRIDEFVIKLGKLPTVKAKKAIALDEPDDSYHMASEKGKILRRILGKLRQQHLAISLCATDLNDIPNYMFRKLDGIFFLPNRGTFLYFKNKPNKESYLVQQIRAEYAKKGYQIFFELQNKEGCLKGSTIGGSPYDLDYEKGYLQDKADDYRSDIDDFINKTGSEDALTPENDLIHENMIKDLENKMSISKVSQKYGRSRRYIALEWAKEKRKAILNEINVQKDTKNVAS